MEKTHKIIISLLMIFITFIIVINTFVYKNIAIADGEDTTSGNVTNEEETYPPLIPINETTYYNDGTTVRTEGHIDQSGNEVIDSVPGGPGIGEVDDEDDNYTWTKPVPEHPRDGFSLFASNCGGWEGQANHEFTWNDLIEHGDLLCNQHGARLRGRGAAPYGSLGDPRTYTVGPRIRSNLPTGYLTKSKYSGGGEVPASPVEAYVLSQATHSPNGYVKTPAQLAWWYVTDQGGKNNDIVKAAKDFYSYLKATGYEWPKGGVYESENHDDKNKPLKVGYWKVNYNPQWIVDTEDFDSDKVKYIKDKEALKNPTVEFKTSNGNEVTIGDFAIDYVYHETYAFMTKMEITLNDSNNTVLKLSEGDFEIFVENKDYLDKYGYPLPGRPFQIKIKDKKDATKIVNIHVEFKYTTGKGSYNAYITTAQERTVHSTSTGKYNTDKQLLYMGDVTIKNEVDTQDFVGGYNVEIDNFTKVLNRYASNEGQIEVQKIVVDEDDGDNTELDVDKFYEFKVTVEGKESEAEILRVKANSTVTSKVYRWGINESAPKYTVEELNAPDGSVKMTDEKGNVVDGNKVTGNLINGKTAIVTATNKIKPKSGMLLIKKKVVDEFDRVINSPINMNNQTQENEAEAGTEFDFTVTVKGKFRYYEDETGWRRI